MRWFGLSFKMIANILEVSIYNITTFMLMG